MASAKQLTARKKFAEMIKNKKSKTGKVTAKKATKKKVNPFAKK